MKFKLERFRPKPKDRDVEHTAEEESSNGSQEETRRVNSEDHGDLSTLLGGNKKEKTWYESVYELPYFTLTVVIILVCIIATVVPVVLAVCMEGYDADPFSNDAGTCALPPEYRFPCLTGTDTITEENCFDAGCCYWDSGDDVRAPICFHSYPSAYHYKKVDNRLEPTIRNMPTGHNISSIGYVIKEEGNGILRITLSTKDTGTSGSSGSSSALQWEVRESPYFNFTVKRKDTKSVMFDTSYGAIIFSEEYTELTTRACSSAVYGLPGGGDVSSLRSLFVYERHKLYSRNDVNSIGSLDTQPFYMCIEDDSGNAHGVFLNTARPVEITMQSVPSITFRTLGGDLDFYIIPGTSPKEVLQNLQSLSFIDRPKVPPPYWSLGFQMCREGNGAGETTSSIENMYNYDLPFDSDCIDSSLTLGSPFDLDINKFLNLSDIFDLLSNQNKKVTLVQKPHIFARISLNQTYNNSLVRDSTGLPYIGTYKGEKVAFVDYCDEELREKLAVVADEFLGEDLWGNDTEVIGGFLFLDNTPINEGSNHRYNNTPPFFYDFSGNGELSFSKDTINLNMIHVDDSIHYQVHNKYGDCQLQTMREVWNSVLPDNNLLYGTQSSWIGTGQTSVIMGGKYSADYLSMKQALIEVLRQSMVGNPLTGIPVCGSIDSVYGLSADEMEDVCRYWLELWMTMPFTFSDYQSGQMPRNPGQLSKGFQRDAERILQQKYKFLPYMYSLMWEWVDSGVPPVRPMVMEYPHHWAYDMDEQFMVGSAVMVIPSLMKDEIKVVGKYPPGCWYDYHTGELVYSNDTHADNATFPVNSYMSALLTQGGFIIPMQAGSSSAMESRLSPFSLLVSLDCSTSTAEGRIIVDDGNPREKYTSFIEMTAKRDKVIKVILKRQGECNSDTVEMNTSIGEVKMYYNSEDDDKDVEVMVTVDGMEDFPANVTMPASGVILVSDLEDINFCDHETITFDFEFIEN